MTRRDPEKRKTAGEPPGRREEPRPDERRGPDWEPPHPEWAPSGRPQGERPPRPGEPAKKGDDVGPGPAKKGDPPIEQPFGARSRHGGSGGPPPDGEA